MKKIVLILFMGIIGNVQAGIIEEWYPQCLRKSDSFDESLKNNQSKYIFEFSTLDGGTNRMVYSIDGRQKTVKLKQNAIEVFATPGKHIFQFYYSQDYYEVYTDSLEIKNRFTSTYEVRMERSDIQIMSDKPVIYLYPEKEVEVSVKLNIKGESTFLYPEYQNGWEFTASPSGDLTFGDKTYNYLFWEAAISRTFSDEELKSGFNVKKANVVSFLEEKLDLAGLNSKEKADFITYWGPRLAANELNFVRFEFNEQCNRYAEIEINPKPKNVYRIYMTWMPISRELEVAGQEIESYSREGFTVLEWGGSELNPKQHSIKTSN